MTTQLETHIVRVAPGWIGHLSRLCASAGAPFSAIRVHSHSTSAESIEEAHASRVTPLLLRHQRAAEVLEVSESALRWLIRNGQLPVVKVNGSTRVRVADLQNYVAALDAASQREAS